MVVGIEHQVYPLHTKQPLTHITMYIHVLSLVLQAKGKSVLTTCIEGSNTQNQKTTDVSNQPDLMHKLASSEGTLSVSGFQMMIDDTLQSLGGPSLQQDPSALTQLSPKKAVLPCRGVQLPQNIINELSTVLHKTGRFPKEDN